MARALITLLPPRARRGDVVEVRVLVAHPMETGHRVDAEGRTVPRDILTRFTCQYDGGQVCDARLFPAITANPYLSFFVTAAVSGPLRFTWQGDGGFTQTETASLLVE